MRRRCLILACSATKRSDPGLLPAIARYDGPAWRTVRRNMTVTGPLLALSARYGLLSAFTPIPDYDERMTLGRARELIGPVAAELALIAGDVREVYAFGGGIYRDLLEQARVLAEAESGRPIPIGYTTGGIGDQLGQLKAWLGREA